MKEIQLLYVINEVSSKKGLGRQELSFVILVENLTFSKKIDIVWAGEDAIWHTLPADFYAATEGNKEYWRAQATFSQELNKPLPGNIMFALRYQTPGQEFWDNHHGLNYRSLANSGIQVADDCLVQNIGYLQTLENGRKLIPIIVATNQTLRAKKVTIHWTTNNWQQVHVTRCYQKRNRALNRDGEPIQDGVQIWKGLLNISNAFGLEYSICCESEDKVVWDNNYGRNYTARRKLLKVLALNLHCMQEENQDAKFSVIAKAIDEQQIDIVCLQEVAEPWNDGRGNPEMNSAKIINERLDSPFYLYTDWSHLGFDRYREGVAILSRYPVIQRDSRYISVNEDPYSIHSRKVVMAQISVPHIGLINVFSSHLSWWNDGFSVQFENLHKWAESKRTANIKATMLCGDFNIKAGSKGYSLVVDTDEYEDQWLVANSPQIFEKVFVERQPNWQTLLDDDHRIDFIFLHRTSSLQAISANALFTEQDYGCVSDHQGYLLAFEPKEMCTSKLKGLQNHHCQHEKQITEPFLR